MAAVVPTHRCGAVPDPHQVLSCLGPRPKAPVIRALRSGGATTSRRKRNAGGAHRPPARSTAQVRCRQRGDVDAPQGRVRGVENRDDSRPHDRGPAHGQGMPGLRTLQPAARPGHQRGDRFTAVRCRRRVGQPGTDFVRLLSRHLVQGPAGPGSEVPAAQTVVHLGTKAEQDAGLLARQLGSTHHTLPRRLPRPPSAHARPRASSDSSEGNSAAAVADVGAWTTKVTRAPTPRSPMHRSSDLR